MKEILGKKLGMTRVFIETGEAIPVTVIEAGPCPVVAKCSVDKEGYEALRVGFGPRRKQRTNRPLAGQFVAAKVEPTRYLRELRGVLSEVEIGASLTVDMFNKGERVDVCGVSRGLGFAGTMKRHGFSGGQATHGQSDRLRAPGSIGCSSYPSRVFKGKRMSGRMGHDRVTVLNLEIVDIIEKENLILIKGSVPGFSGGLLRIRSSNRG